MTSYDIFGYNNLDFLFEKQTVFKSKNGENLVYEILAPGLEKTDFNVFLTKNVIKVVTDIKSGAETKPYVKKLDLYFTLNTCRECEIQCSYVAGILRIEISEKGVFGPDSKIEVK